MNYNRSKKQQKKRRTMKRQSRKITGGVGAWSFGEHVYGDAASQSSVEGTSNTIKMISGSTYIANPDNYADKVVVDGVSGGKKTTKGGRGILTDIAIPAVLLYANNSIGKKRRNKNKYKKTRTKSKRVRFSRKNKK